MARMRKLRQDGAAESGCVSEPRCCGTGGIPGGSKLSLRNVAPKLVLMNQKKGMFDRLVAELNRDVPNIEGTLEHVSVEAIEMAGVVQSSFAEFNSLVSSSPDLFQRHSAFYIYHTDATFFSLRALREALCSYYGAAGSLLRNACEAILRGTFWECLAHRRYREHAAVLAEPKQKRKIDGSRRNVLDWMNDVACPPNAQQN